MAIVLAIPHLFDAVVARFATDGTACPNLFGWRESGRQLEGGARIVWTPGDTGGKLGEHLPPRGPGGNPRALYMLDERVTCEIQACDTSAPENERAQYQATRELYCLWLRAIYLAARGTYRVVDAAWAIEKTERRRGACIRAVLAVQAVIPDIAFPLAPVDSIASFDVSLLDVTENLSVGPA